VSKFTAEEELARARAAENLLAEPLLVEAFVSIESNAFTAWVHTSDSDSAMRERLYQRVIAVRLLRTYLTKIVSQPKVAAMQYLRANPDAGSGADPRVE